MKKMRLGNSRTEISAVGLGAWAIGGGEWWGENDDAESVKAIHAALDCGYTLIDTAPVYGFGHSEEVVGKALQGRRDKVILSTKCGLLWDTQEGAFHFEKEGRRVYKNVTKAAVIADVERSLRRLKIDYIDILFTHWQASEPLLTPVSETMEAMNQLKKEGKIRHIGASNVTAWHVQEYTTYGELDIIQERYSILDRRVEEDLLPLCKEKGITLQAYSPLEQGILTGKIGKDYRPAPGEAREGKKWYQPRMLEQAVDMVTGWDTFCSRYACTKAQLAVAWLLAQGENVNVLCGGRKISQVEDNAKGADIALEPADVKAMREMAEAIDC